MKITIGNDFRISWSLSQLGEAYTLEGKVYELVVHSSYGVIDVANIVASGNTLTFTIPASSQIYAGSYDIILNIAYGDNHWRLCHRDVFELVPCGGEIADIIQLEDNIIYPYNGLSAYELAVASGEYTGDYAGYQRWLARYAEAAAGQALDTAQQANATAGDAKTIAKQANTTADDANATADDAKTIAKQANTTADDANATADDAKTIAQQANTTAGDANATADDAKTIAQQANTTAGDANSTAGEANAIANRAANIASNAYTVSSFANNTANQANATANQANTTASEANTIAEQANATADEAKEIAERAMSVAGNYVSYEAQAPTADEQWQARNNIGAPGVNEYAPGMSVGVADNLTGRGEAIEREFVFEQSAGVTTSILKEDTARIESIRGNTFVYNQLATLPNNQIYELNGVMASWANGEVTLNGQATDNCLFSKSVVIGALTPTHKYLVCGFSQEGSSNTFGLVFGGDGSKIYGNKIITAGSSTGFLYPVVYNGYNAENVKIKPRVYDLTKMFGVGNEPTTVEEAERIINQLNVTDGYNAGELINNNTTAIKTVGFNIINTSGDILQAPTSSQADAKTWAEEGKMYQGIASNGYTTDVTNPSSALYSLVVKNEGDALTITNGAALYGLGIFCKILPNTEYTSLQIEEHFAGGLRVTVSYYDENKIYIGNENVNNGTFTIYPNAVYVFMVYVVVGGGTVTLTNPCVHLTNSYRNGDYELYREFTRELPTVEGGLKSAGTVYDELRYNHLTDKWEYVKRVGERAYAEGDDSDTSVVTDGTTTYYALDEAVTTELDTDISPDYDVEDWGTEEAIQVAPSAPFKAMIKYGFNAVDQIRGNKLNIDDLLTRVAALEAQLTSLTTNTQNDETTA